MKISQLSELVGSVIPEIALTVDNCYKLASGQGAKGPWTRQDLMCSDESGTIKVCVWNHSEMDQAIRGTQVKFKSIPSKRGSGVVGVKVIENEYNGVKSVQLKVDDAGIIITQTGSVGSKSLDTGYDKKQTQSDQIGKAVMNAITPSIKESFESNLLSKPTTTDPDAKVEQYTKLYQLCLDWSDTIKHVGFNNEDYRQIASCFFIQGIKDGLHLQMTVKPDLENDDINF